jgi:hypothetical protein
MFVERCHHPTQLGTSCVELPPLSIVVKLILFTIAHVFYFINRHIKTKNYIAVCCCMRFNNFHGSQISDINKQMCKAIQKKSIFQRHYENI